MSANGTTAVALTVAGSDSGGGAGIQADLKTFHALGVFGTCAITAITCQNPQRVSAVQAVRADIVGGQIDRVLEAFRVRGAKTGMLYNAVIIEAVAERRLPNLVVDPVMVATSGARLLKPSAVAALEFRLFPRAKLVTPNLIEAEILAGRPIRSLEELHTAAHTLAEKHGVPFLVKGGHMPGWKRAVDVLCEHGQCHEFSAPLIPGIVTHGTGCTYSAAIAANLALGHRLVDAVGRAKIFVTRAIRDAVRIGRFHVLRV
jgi:hydroxymethylpyrimidine kinase/phosphomethylpyrimidine kinase